MGRFIGNSCATKRYSYVYRCAEEAPAEVIYRSMHLGVNLGVQLVHQPQPQSRAAIQYCCIRYNNTPNHLKCAKLGTVMDKFFDKNTLIRHVHKDSLCKVIVEPYRLPRQIEAGIIINPAQNVLDTFYNVLGFVCIFGGKGSEIRCDSQQSIMIAYETFKHVFPEIRYTAFTIQNKKCVGLALSHLFFSKRNARVEIAHCTGYGTQLKWSANLNVGVFEMC